MINFEIVERFGRQVALADNLSDFLTLYKPSRFTDGTVELNEQWLKTTGHTLISRHESCTEGAVWYYDPMPPTLKEMPPWVRGLPPLQSDVIMKHIVEDIKFRRMIMSADEDVQAEYKAILDSDVNLGWILQNKPEILKKGEPSKGSQQWQQLTLA